MIIEQTIMDEHRERFQQGKDNRDYCNICKEHDYNNVNCFRFSGVIEHGD